MDKVFKSDFVHGTVEIPDESIDNTLPELLRTIREHLRMDVAFISEFTDKKRVFRYVDSSLAHSPVQVGGAGPLEESYCQRVVDGRLPELLPDAGQHPAALALPVTTLLPVGAHLSVPIRLTDGSIYGTFCCFSHAPNKALNERDLAMMRVFATMVGKSIDRNHVARKQTQEIEQRIKSVLSGNDLSSVYQPIYHLEHDKIVGFESLSRFSAIPARTPDVWFNEAAKVGLGVELETKAVQAALQGMAHLPADVYISFNVSPETILSGTIESAFNDAPLERIVLEITEHASTDRYRDIATIIRPLKDQGLRIAVDDAGAGYASFRHILNLAPDLIKLDVSLTQNIHTDRARRALAAALIRFSEETGSKIIAEGVETTLQLKVLRELGVTKAQGYLLGRPMPLASASELCSAHGKRRL